jgi:hypothetical protein
MKDFAELLEEYPLPDDLGFVDRLREPTTGCRSI